MDYYDSVDSYKIYIQAYNEVGDPIQVDQNKLGIECRCEGPEYDDGAVITYNQSVNYDANEKAYEFNLSNIECSTNSYCTFNIWPTYEDQILGEMYPMYLVTTVDKSHN